MDSGVFVLTRLWLGSWLCLHISHKIQDGHTLVEKIQNISDEGNAKAVNKEQTSGSKNRHQPALVGTVRGEFVTAAAVRCVAEGSIGGGRTWLGAHNATGRAAGFKVPIRRFVSATLAGEVTAHPLHYLFHHLVFKLEKKNVLGF